MTSKRYLAYLRPDWCNAWQERTQAVGADVSQLTVVP